MTWRLPQNPGLGGLDELTTAEELFLQNLAGLTYAQGDILYHDGNDLVNLGPGVNGQFLKTQGAAANPVWATAAGAGDFLADGSVPMTGDFNLDGSNIDNGGVIFLKEQAEADADVAGSGQIWVNTATPNELWFTDDAGTDVQLGLAGATPTDITVADESTDTTCFPLFVTAATGDLGPKSGGNLTFNSNTGALAATSFVGPLTGQADTVATITGLAPDTATTQATQAAITTCANLVTVGALDAGSITANFGTINNGASAITTTGAISGGAITGTSFVIGAATITEAELEILDGATVTTTELNIIDGSTAATGTTLADADRCVVNDNGTMKQVAMTDFETYMETSLDTLSSVTTVGTLNAGAISSGFGNIDIGASTFTTTGTAALGNITLGTDGTVSSLVLTEKASIALDPASGADGDYSGISVAGTAGATLAFGDVVYLAVADSRWELADADAIATGQLIGIVVLAAAGDASATTILLHGIIRADTAFPAITVGAPVYLGTTAGDLVTTAPSGADDVVKVLGFGLTANEVYWNPSPNHLTHTG